MKCEGCGNENAYRWRMVSGAECCDGCSALGSVQNPDVFFKEPYWDPHLGDHRKGERSVWVESRAHKAQLLAERGWKEIGDKQGGARVQDKFVVRREQEQGRQKWT